MTQWYVCHSVNSQLLFNHISVDWMAQIHSYVSATWTKKTLDQVNTDR